MIINCDSCQKKFVVPDSAIGQSGRLVQCSSCGNKWTQYPIEEKPTPKIEQIKLKVAPNKIKIKKTKKNISKKNKGLNPYSKEYLAKKHGIKIIDPSQGLSLNKKNKEIFTNINFGFYNYLFCFIVFLITLLGIINLTQEIIISYYPEADSYIYYIFETLNNIKTIISDLISNY
jgi:predicted Zn finger-like uncharacterized protein